MLSALQGLFDYLLDFNEQLKKEVIIESLPESLRSLINNDEIKINGDIIGFTSLGDLMTY